jgi:hypothetical protein
MHIPDDIKKMVHGLNADAFKMNKGIIQKSTTMQDVPLNQEIYGTPQPTPRPQAVPVQPVSIPQPVPQPQITGDPALLNSLIERVSSVEKQITKFVNLIERRVAKNAKEINIRIKLDNDSTDTE